MINSTLTMDYPNATSDTDQDEFLPPDSSTICKPLVRILMQNKPVPELFYELVNRLDKFFSISKASLIIKSPADDTLRMMAMWDNSVMRQGVMLTLPRKQSLFHKAVKQKSIFYQPIIDAYRGNFIERKILYTDNACTLAICPLIWDGNFTGLISLTSPVPFAFDMIEEGRFGPLMRYLGKVLLNNRSTNILNPALEGG